MSASKKKTVLRTVRLTRNLDELIQKDAKEKNLSVNGLVNRIVTKYVEWDRYISKFGFISIANETFQDILEQVDDEKIENIAKELGQQMPQAVTLFWFKELSLETFLKTITLYSKYSGLHRIEIERDEDCVITFHHNLGEKWSVFLRHFISQFVESAVGVVPETKVLKSLMVARIPCKKQD